MSCRRRSFRAWHRMVVVAAASLQWHLAVHHGCATDSAPLITSGIGGAKRSADTIRASTSLDGQSSNSDSGRSPNDTAGSSLSLLDKYTFRETIKKMLEEDHLPELPDFLDGIGLGNRLEDFYRKSVFETKYLFTMNDMDLRLIGLSPEEMIAVKSKMSELRVEKEITEERIHPLLARRNELTYGRLFIDRSASSFEFYLAGFGPPAPLDEAPLIWADPRNACRPPTNSGLSGAIVLAERGQCSFVEKANIMAASNATALVVINNGDEGEDLFRVAATLGGRSGGESEPKGPKSMSTAMVRGSALVSLSKALEWGPVTARLVPLDCKPGKAACEAVLPEEQDAEKQVDSGTISIIPGTFFATANEAEGVPSIPEAFEFLSATFGATLPKGHISVVSSIPEDACSSLATSSNAAISESSAKGGAAVVVKRGGCSFGAKAKNVQNAGGRVIVIEDSGLGVLQNIGAPDPLAKELYIPGVFITARAGEAITKTTRDREEGRDRRIGGLTMAFDPDNSVGRAWGALGAISWPKDLLEARVLKRQLQATHAGSPCRLQWIADKVRQVEGPDLPPVEVTPAVTASEEASSGPSLNGLRESREREAEAGVKRGVSKEL